MQSTLAMQFGESVSKPARFANFRLELLFFAALLVILNAPLLSGAWNAPFAFLPERVMQGEWWRVITHPFVHVSGYHLLLDGAAFFMLYAELREWTLLRRLTAVAATALGSLLAALTSPVVFSNGFGGLSGVAHGLMAISAMEMIRGSTVWTQRAGWCALIIVVAKAAVEAATGNVALGFLHFGLMGLPVAACHAGGVMGGLLMSFAIQARRKPSPVLA